MGVPKDPIALTAPVKEILGNTIGSDYFESLKENYSSKSLAFDLGGGNAVDSIFNKFNLFRYSKFGAAAGEYDVSKHFDVNSSGDAAGLISQFTNAIDTNPNNFGAALGEAVTSVLSKFAVKSGSPTASQLIESSSKLSTYGPVPYSWEDFLYCKYYGLIPNNRLLTLRRYPMPVEDHIQTNESSVSNPLVPISQAVTWFGETTDNSLSKILNLSWNFKYKELTADVRTVDGNEIRLDEVIAAISGIIGANEKAVDVISTGTLIAGKDTENLSKKEFNEITKRDAQIYDYQKKMYEPDGPYWNKILGPVNVINSTVIRDRGMGEDMWRQPIVLKFHYSLRSYATINPKIAMLDLISNFLSLTYNTASWWGGAIRYFPKAGVPFSHPFITALNNGDYNEARTQLLKLLKSAGKVGADQLKTLLTAGYNAITNTKDKATSKKIGTLGENIADAATAKLLSNFLQKPLVMRSMLSGKPTGEWHLTVGNPLDPIAVIGNLLVDKVDAKFSEELGIDDFPTEIVFTVTLRHGKPRDKADIESMFNLGKGPLSYTRLPNPTSAHDNPNAGLPGVPDNPNAKDIPTVGKPEVETDDKKDLAIASGGEDILSRRRRVRKSYSEDFANSSFIETMYTNFQTKG